MMTILKFVRCLLFIPLSHGKLEVCQAICQPFHSRTACDACLSTSQKSTQSPSKIHWINTRVLIRSIAVICLMRLVSRHEWGREFTSNSETASAWCSTHFKDNINWYVLLNTPKLCDRTGKKSHWLYYDKDLTFITAYSLKENVWFCPWFSFAIGVIDL